MRRLYELKGRPAERPAAVMFFDAGARPGGASRAERRRARGAARRCCPDRSRCCCPTARAASRWPAAPATGRRHAGPARPAARRRAGGASRGRPSAAAVQRQPVRRARRAAARRCAARASCAASISCSTAASCRASPRPSSTCASYERDGAWSVVREGALRERSRARAWLSRAARRGHAASAPASLVRLPRLALRGGSDHREAVATPPRAWAS